MNLTEFELTEEKVLKLKPIIEKILSRKHGKEIKFADLSIGNITVEVKKEATSKA
ncbi:hypothetical protein ACFOU2_09840 [Bacillus songklensis]|uniref:Uncharacterized protein n=1 Tax=Bacillus songklensis TaxID=1069116 RepID=A0ABV8B3H2_9BACI